MVELGAEMADLWGRIGAGPAGSKAVLFTAAAPGEGVSTLAREFAFFAARRAARRVWLVDMDLMGSPQATAIRAARRRYGPLGPPSAASPTGAVFFAIQPPLRRPDGRAWPDDRYLVAHAVGAQSLWVTTFRHEALRESQTVKIVPAGEYWRALRRHAQLIVVDAPSGDRSVAALTAAKFMDEIVLVLAADQPDFAATSRLREAVLAAGGQVSGLFLNRATVQTPPFLKAVLQRS
ncbi:MAG: sugar kinase [Caulobacteraceae bacterium]